MKNENTLEYYIPTYIINLKERAERKEHIVNEFEGKPEFGVTFVDACIHSIGAVGLWNSIVKVIESAVKQKDDVILICEDDHYFTENYSQKYFFESIVYAHSKQKEFGYSDITQANKDNPNLITQLFERTDAYLSAIHKVSGFYNYPNI